MKDVSTCQMGLANVRAKRCLEIRADNVYLRLASGVETGATS